MGALPFAQLEEWEARRILVVTVALLSEFPEPCWLPIEKSGVLVVVVVVEGVVLHVV